MPRSWRREVTPSLLKTLRRCHSTVRLLMNNCSPISEFDRPSPASRAICASWAVSWSGSSIVRFRQSRAGRRQFAASALGEAVHSHRTEQLVPDAELAACVCSAVRASEPFAVEQVNAREFGPDQRPAQVIDGRAVQVLGLVAIAEQRLGPGGHPQCPIGSAGVGLRGQLSRGIGRQPELSGPAGRFDQFGQSPVVRDHLLRILAGPPGGDQRLFVPAHAVAQDGMRVLADRDADTLATGACLAQRDLDQLARLGDPPTPRGDDQRSVRCFVDAHRLPRRPRLLDQQSGR